MMLHEILIRTAKGKKRIGRGGKRGTTAGRGTKGQRSRAGHKIRPELRDIIQRIPKQRGQGFSTQYRPVIAVDLDMLEKHFKAGEKVTPRTLEKRGLIVLGKVRPVPRVKILARGSLSKKLILENIDASSSAAEKIIGKGGELRGIER
jgi:large subunit ribosomal protein L15